MFFCVLYLYDTDLRDCCRLTLCPLKIRAAEPSSPQWRIKWRVQLLKRRPRKPQQAQLHRRQPSLLKLPQALQPKQESRLQLLELSSNLLMHRLTALGRTAALKAEPLRRADSGRQFWCVCPSYRDEDELTCRHSDRNQLPECPGHRHTRRLCKRCYLNEKILST